MAWLSRIATTSGYVDGILGPMILFGIGVGLCFMPLNAMIMMTVSARDAGAASGLLQSMQRTGSAVGAGTEHIRRRVGAIWRRRRPYPSILRPLGSQVVQTGSVDSSSTRIAASRPGKRMSNSARRRRLSRREP
ncbi:hypothetical protein MXD58_000345 [Frankia sp. AgKG'84/4]|nr:hypothetical protein [Frankia sp. AgKG'84/4]MCL9792787.1 hypothetical protein [Frankia sp. AgKG'84/4]